MSNSNHLKNLKNIEISVPYPLTPFFRGDRSKPISSIGSRNRFFSKNPKSFSLVELLVVVAIIAILIGAALPFYQDYVKDTQVSKAQQDLDTIRQAISLYEVNEGRPYYPYSRSDAGGLLYGIHSGGSDLRGLRGSYLSDIPFDPWGREYKYDRFSKSAFSEGPIVNKYDPADPSYLVTQSDDIKSYVIRELTIRKVDWLDRNNNSIIDSGDIFELVFSKHFFNPAGPAAADFEFFDPNGSAPQTPILGNDLLDSSTYPTAAAGGDASLAATNGYESHSTNPAPDIETVTGVHFVYRLGIGLGVDTTKIKPGVTAMRLTETGVNKFKTVRMNRNNPGGNMIFSNFPESEGTPAVSFSEPIVIKKKK